MTISVSAIGRPGPNPKALLDDFVKSPTSALRFIALSLRRTIRTPRDTRFARLEFGTFYKAVFKLTFYEPSTAWAFPKTMKDGSDD
jgi:hypothetical protein